MILLIRTGSGVVVVNTFEAHLLHGATKRAFHGINTGNGGLTHLQSVPAHWISAFEHKSFSGVGGRGHGEAKDLIL